MASANITTGLSSAAAAADEVSSAKKMDVDVNAKEEEKTASGSKRLAESAEKVDLPEEQKNVVLELKNIQEVHRKFEEEYRDEWNLLKMKYYQKFQPLYQSRKLALVSDVPADAVPAVPAVGTNLLPSFWLKAMKNHPMLSEMIETNDVEILEHLQDIAFEWVVPKEQTSFKINFYFSKNGFFEDSVLSKMYHLERAEDNPEESVLTKTEGTMIKWYPDKNVTEKKIMRKQKNKRTSQFRTITEVIEANSFFNFFQSHEIPSEEQLESMEEREVAELEMIVEAEFEVGCILRDKIIPRALGWYLGIEKDSDAESEGGSEEAERDYDEDEDDDSDDDN